MRTGWLSEAGGEYVLTFMQQVTEPLPTFADLQAGQRLALAGQSWTVSNREEAECIAGQGELPFKVGAGYPVPAVDLRNQANFATLDYSETPPLLFIGEAVRFDALAMNGLRDGMAVPEQKVEAQVFRCPSCGAPMQARSKDILAVGCASCGTVVDAADKNHKVLSKALASQAEQVEPRIPLGSKGMLDNEEVEAIGFMVRQCKVDGIFYRWREYLLATPDGRYRWLTEYNGHWNVADNVSRPPRLKGGVEAPQEFEGRDFKHFQTTPEAEVLQVAGEFTWRVRVGERCKVIDYVAPPSMLSRESTKNDMSWSLANYVAPEAIASAFRLKAALPEPVGVYANQPNPWQEARHRSFSVTWKLALLALVVQIFFLMLGREHQLLRQEFTFEPHQGEVVSREFEVSGRARKLTVRNDSSLDNHWMSLELMLVNKATGESWPASRELAFYHGYDDGYWTEGSQRDEVVFQQVPPGTYYLAVNPEIGPEKLMAVRDSLQVSTAGAGWSNFVLVLLFLAIFPVFAAMRHAAFEAQRWMESDHPPANSSDEEDD
jgi:hypothetical protein